MVSEKAIATGIESDMPMVSGLGPRETRYGVLLNGACSRLAVLEARSKELIAGLWRPGRGRDLLVVEGGGRIPPASEEGGRCSLMSGLCATVTENTVI